MRTLALGALALTFLACSKAAQDPYDAFADGDYEAAAAGFETRLASAEGEERFELQLDRLRALSYFDAGAAEVGFRELTEDPETATRVTPKEVSLVTSELISAGAHMEAIGVMEVGIERWPEDPRIEELYRRVKRAAETAGDPKVSSRIDGIGYGGGHDE